MCDRWVPRGATLYGCTPCNYDLCLACVGQRKRAPPKKTPGSMTASELQVALGEFGLPPHGSLAVLKGRLQEAQQVAQSKTISGWKAELAKRGLSTTGGKKCLVGRYLNYQQQAEDMKNNVLENFEEDEEEEDEEEEDEEEQSDDPEQESEEDEEESKEEKSHNDARSLNVNPRGTSEYEFGGTCPQNHRPPSKPVDSMKVEELKNELRERKLPLSGNKHALVERLQQARQQTKRSANDCPQNAKVELRAVKRQRAEALDPRPSKEPKKKDGKDNTQGQGNPASRANVRSSVPNGYVNGLPVVKKDPYEAPVGRPKKTQPTEGKKIKDDQQGQRDPASMFSDDGEDPAAATAVNPATPTKLPTDLLAMLEDLVEEQNQRSSFSARVHEQSQQKVSEKLERFKAQQTPHLEVLPAYLGAIADYKNLRDYPLRTGGSNNNGIRSSDMSKMICKDFENMPFSVYKWHGLKHFFEPHPTGKQGYVPKKVDGKIMFDVDHVVPQKWGGINHPRNFVVMHRSMNRSFQEDLPENKLAYIEKSTRTTMRLVGHFFEGLFNSQVMQVAVKQHIEKQMPQW